MKRKVIRDQAGNLINIGPWDYRRASVAVIAEGGEEIPASVASGGELLGHREVRGGERGLVRRVEVYARKGETIPARQAEPGERLGFAKVGAPANPMPEGAYEDTAEIVAGRDGGLYEKGDPRAG